MEDQKNGWDHANRQGENRDFNKDGYDQDQYLQEEVNPNKDADGYGSESARSDHSNFDSGMGSRSGNNHEPHVAGSRSYEQGGGSSGSSGRSS